jgi:drug/metabolite transporter (DMT)-like permease
MSLPYDLLALAAAACWALGSMLSVSPARHLGAFAFSRLRMLMVAGMLWLAAWATDGWHAISSLQFGLMAASGVIGIFIGDTVYFAAMNRLGPRRTGVLFATHAIFSACLGYLAFGERMSLQAAVGAGMTVAGVMIAILLGRRKAEDHAWESNRGHPGVGIALGLIAALCQAVATLIAKPAMATGMDPIAAAAIRVSVACAAHYVLLWSRVPIARPSNPPCPRVIVQTALCGLVGMAIGMTLLLLALRFGDVGMVAVLSSVTPILLLPLLWLHLRRPPARGAWFGATLTVAGTALILSR